MQQAGAGCKWQVAWSDGRSCGACRPRCLPRYRLSTEVERMAKQACRSSPIQLRGDRATPDAVSHEGDAAGLRSELALAHQRLMQVTGPCLRILLDKRDGVALVHLLNKIWRNHCRFLVQERGVASQLRVQYAALQNRAETSEARESAAAAEAERLGQLADALEGASSGVAGRLAVVRQQLSAERTAHKRTSEQLSAAAWRTEEARATVVAMRARAGAALRQVQDVLASTQLRALEAERAAADATLAMRGQESELQMTRDSLAVSFCACGPRYPPVSARYRKTDEGGLPACAL
jgi:hypothetical protein